MAFGTTKSSRILIGIATVGFGIALPLVGLVLTERLPVVAIGLPYLFWMGLISCVTGLTFFISNMLKIEVISEGSVTFLGQKFPILVQGPTLILLILLTGASYIFYDTELYDRFDQRKSFEELIAEQKAIEKDRELYRQQKDIYRAILSGHQIEGQVSVMNLGITCAVGANSKIVKWQHSKDKKTYYSDTTPLFIGEENSVYKIIDERSSNKPLVEASISFNNGVISSDITILDLDEFSNFCLEYDSETEVAGAENHLEDNDEPKLNE